MNYARVLVEVDVTNEFIEEVRVERANGTEFLQRVQYEWKPYYCSKCCLLGHKFQERARPKEVLRWVPKHAVTSQVAEVVVQESTHQNEIPPVVSESEGGWVAATKVARNNQINTMSIDQKSFFALFQSGLMESDRGVDEESTECLSVDK